MNTGRFVQRQRLRLRRIRRMSAGELRGKLRQRVSALSPPRLLAWMLFPLERWLAGCFDRPYGERAESGAVNFELKMARVAAGGPFEPESIALLNLAAATLVGDARRILELGCGTGMFAFAAARRHPEASITASELDEDALAWARANRAVANIDYCTLRVEECAADRYDLVVAIELIEHLADFGGFLKELVRVAPRALITTPNKNRSARDAVAPTPACKEHVREWSAGEFYWVLRGFYGSVELFCLPNERRQVQLLRSDAGYRPRVARCGPLTRSGQLIALCRRSA